MRLHFSIGGYDYRKTTRFRQSIQFSGIQILFAEHVHRRTGVHNKFDGESRHQFSEGAKNVVLYFSFSFRIILAIFHVASRA